MSSIKMLSIEVYVSLEHQTTHINSQIKKKLEETNRMARSHMMRLCALLVIWVAAETVQGQGTIFLSIFINVYCICG